MPDTPAGKALGEFIRAFNTGDLETLKRFHRERGGDEENARQDIGFYQESGGLRIHSVTRSAQFEIEVLAQMKKGERWVSFAIGVGPQAPYEIADIRISPASAPGAKSGASVVSTEPGKEKLSDAGLIERLNAMINKSVADDSFSGVVIIAKDDKPIFQRAVGLASKSYNVHNRVDTIYARAAFLQELIPGLKVGVGHGQMGEDELEKALMGFMRHDFDVFVCTTIPEN